MAESWQTFYTDYNEARRIAGVLALSTGHDYAIRACSEYGRKGYTARMASVNDSDYARSEIVKPADPQWTKTTIVPSGYTNDMGREGICLPVRDR